MTINLKLKGTASLIKIHDPQEGHNRCHYFVRIKADNGSLYGKNFPLEYDIPLSQEQFEKLEKQVNADDFRVAVGEAEHYEVVPHIEANCNVELIARKGEV